MPAAEERRPGRPRGSSGAALLAVAREEFLAHGFAGTTMDAIASRARVSKSSLYRDYASKDVLFAAMVTDWVDRGRDAMKPVTDALVEASDTPGALARLGRSLQAAVLSSDVLRMRALVAAESARFPGVASDYVERSWNRNMSTLAAALGVLARRGALAAPRPHVAAEQFVWLVIAAPLNRLTLAGSAAALPRAELDRICDEGVATFLARYGPGGPGQREPGLLAGHEALMEDGRPPSAS